MSELVRFGVSIESELLEAFDSYIAEKSYTNRSEAIRDLIRQSLAAGKWEEGGDVAGGIVLVYDHHQRDLTEKLIHRQHHALDLTISNLHVHLDEGNCLEVIVVRGSSDRITALADDMRSMRGVHHCAVARVAAT